MSRRDTSSDDQDLALLDRIRVEDADAHRALFDRYYPRVFSFIQRRLRDPELSEEAAADVFFEIWRSAARFTGDSRVSTWIFGIAQFKALSAHRARSRGKRSAVLPMNVEVLHAVSDDPGTDDRVSSREELRALLDQVDRLPVGQRTVVKMAFIDELEYDDIAERLGVSVGTVKSRIARARVHLRQATNRESEDPNRIQSGVER